MTDSVPYSAMEKLKVKSFNDFCDRSVRASYLYYSCNLMHYLVIKFQFSVNCIF